MWPICASVYARKFVFRIENYLCISMLNIINMCFRFFCYNLVDSLVCFVFHIQFKWRGNFHILTIKKWMCKKRCDIDGYVRIKTPSYYNMPHIDFPVPISLTWTAYIECVCNLYICVSFIIVLSRKLTIN